MNPDVDDYIAGKDAWRPEMEALREILVGCGLREEIKWNKPTYCHGGGNVAIMQPMNDVLGLMFFKGALLDDPDGVLHDQGPNSRSAKRMEFTSVKDVTGAKKAIAAMVKRAVAADEQGVEADPAPEPEHVAELTTALAADRALWAAFDGLTPGRRREYHLHFSSAKRPGTRADRVEKAIPRIKQGKGLRDR